MNTIIGSRKFVINKFNMLFIVVFALALFGCGSGGDTEGSIDPADPIPDVTIASIALNSSLAAGAFLAQGGTTTITATVTESDGYLVADGTEVTFTASSGSISSSALTVSGEAVAIFNAATTGGIVTITATADGVTSSDFSLTVASGSAASISLVSSSPDRLGLIGSGTAEVGTFIFSVKDSGGNPVSDGQIVTFSLNSTTGGGEVLFPSSADTISGEVTAVLTSGSVPGVATVTASTISDGETITTEARITIGYGKTDQLHVGIAVEKLNVPGLIEFGIENTITAFIADRFSNPVPVDTPVYFASECGIVALTDSDGVSTNFTNAFGIASAISITASPTDELCTMILWTEGEEAYIDINGNGIYDDGIDAHQDIGEPFIDANDNGSLDPFETYFDLNLDGEYTPADGVWDADTFVWTSAKVRWSGNTASPQIVPGSFFLGPGTSQTFTITAADVNGNPLPAGTTISVTENCSGASLSGDTSVTVPDALYSGPGSTVFSVNMLNGTSNNEVCRLTVEVSATPNGTTTSSVNGELTDTP